MHPKSEDIWASKDKLKQKSLTTSHYSNWLKISRLFLHNLLAFTDFGRCLWISMNVSSSFRMIDRKRDRRWGGAKLFRPSQSWRKWQKISIVKRRQNNRVNALKNTRISAKLPFNGWQLLFEEDVPEETSLHILKLPRKTGRCSEGGTSHKSR